MALLCPHMTVNALQAVIDVINPHEDKTEIDSESEDEEISDDETEDVEKTWLELAEKMQWTDLLLKPIQANEAYELNALQMG